MERELNTLKNMKKILESIPTPSIRNSVEVVVHPKTAESLIGDYAWTDAQQALQFARVMGLSLNKPIITARPNNLEMSLKMYDRLRGYGDCWFCDFETGNIVRLTEVIESYQEDITPTAKSFSAKRVDKLMTALIAIAKKHQALGIKPKLLKASPLLPNDYTGLEHKVLYMFSNGRLVPYDS